MNKPIRFGSTWRTGKYAVPQRPQVVPGIGAEGCAVCGMSMTVPCIASNGRWVHASCATSRGIAVPPR